FDLGKKIVSPSLTFLCDNYQIDQSLLDYALYVAVKRRQELCVKFLVERGAEGNHRNKRGGTMLMLSTSHIDRRDITHLCDKIVPLLCKTKFDPQLQKDKEGNTPFHYLFGTHAWEEEEEQCGQALLTLGINPNAVNNKGESALHCFVRQCSKTYRDDEDEDYVLNRWCKNIPKCLAFCEKINLDKGIKDKIGHTAKYYASPVLEKYFNYKE
ncbi:MAG TPA: ankyrin repeat domain-containing protein, partial [Candidatus Bathyarchaeia archaeon]|nr:ankyrin repeat domain-containing protein [Candidatus Bathyarchaeia archaeon]